MKKVVLLTTLTFIALNGVGQHQLAPSLSMREMNFYNPSMLSLDSSSTYYVSLLAKKKWVANDDEIWNKPAVLLANFVGRTRDARGFYSVGFLNDRYSYFQRNTFYGGYTHHLVLGGSRLDASVRGSVMIDRVNFDKLKIPTESDGHTTRLGPDLDLGLSYHVGGFSMGAAVHHLFERSTRIDQVDAIQNFRSFIFHGSYQFKIGKSLRLSPHTLVRLKRDLLLDAGACATLFDRVSVSYTLRLNELRGIYAADLRLAKGLFFGLAWDRSALYPDHNGDVFIRYQW